MTLVATWLIALICITICRSSLSKAAISNNDSTEPSPFGKDFYEINLNESTPCMDMLLIFRPDYSASLAVAAADSLRFKFTIISSTPSIRDVSEQKLAFERLATSIFRMDHHTGALTIDLNRAILNKNHYFVVKIIAFDELISRWQTVLVVRLNERLVKRCESARLENDSTNSQNHPKQQENSKKSKISYTKLKLLFADSFQSYDFNKIFQTDDDSERQLDEEAIYLSEDLLVGSFICYVLVQSNLDLKLVGPDSNTFK